MTKENQKLLESPDQLINRVLHPEYIAELMERHDCDIRCGLFHPAMTVWLMMYQRLSGKSSLSTVIEAFQDGIGGVLTERSEGDPQKASHLTGGISQARTRLPDKAVDEIAELINRTIIESHDEHLWNGRQVYIIDGTDFRVRAEGDLKREFPPSRDKTRTSPWSIIRSVVATHAITGVALNASLGAMYGKNAKGEVGLSKEVIENIPSKSVVIADKGLGTFYVAYMAINQGHDVGLRLTEVRAKQALGGRLPKKDGDYECHWSPAKATRKDHNIADSVKLNGRIVRRTIRKAGFDPITLFIFTTLELSADEIVSLYGLRWNVETDFRTMKTSLKMELLDVRSASMARKEIALGICAYNLVRHLLAYAAHQANLSPREISFTRYATRVQFVGMRLAMSGGDEKERQRAVERLTDRVHQLTQSKRKKKRASRPRKVYRHPTPFPSWTTKSLKKFGKIS